MASDLAGVLFRRGAPGDGHRRALERTLGTGARSTALGPLTVAWTGEAAMAGDALCVLAGRRYAGPSPADMLGAGAPSADLRGDFALLGWNGSFGFLARDQIGQRGVFFHDDGGAVRFATEVALLLELLPTRPGPEPRAVAHWLGSSGLPGDLTLYQNVRRLPPGGLLPLDVTRTHVPRRWYEPRFAEPRDGTREDHVQAVRSALVTAVDRRTGDGDTTAVMLSGGLDSSAVAGLSSLLATPRRPRRAYSATFPEHPSVDETSQIEQTCTMLGLASTRVVVRAGSVLEGALPYIERWALPPVSPNLFFWNPLLRRAAGEATSVLLDGEGGDEVFGLSPYLIADELRRGRWRSATGLVHRVPGADRGLSRAQARRFLNTYGVAGLAPPWMHSMSRRLRPAARYVPPYMRPETARAFVSLADGAAWKRNDGPRWWRWMVSATITSMGPALLYDHVRHRALMAGLECRHPLVDLDVLELMLRLPPQLAYDPVRSRPLLREAISGLVPDNVRLRPSKSTFDAVFHDALEGPDRANAAALLDTQARVGAFLDVAAARATLVEATPPREGPGRWNWALQLWRILTLECWLRWLEDPAALTALRGRLHLPAPDFEVCEHRPDGRA